MVCSSSLANPAGPLLGLENSLARALSFVWVQGVQVNTEDGLPLPVIGFSLKGAMITSDFLPSFTAEGEMIGGGVNREERERDKASGLGSSDKGGAEFHFAHKTV